MLKLIPKDPMTILCARCGAYIGTGYTYGLLFYCDTCHKIVEELDIDQ